MYIPNPIEYTKYWYNLCVYSIKLINYKYKLAKRQKFIALNNPTLKEKAMYSFNNPNEPPHKPLSPYKYYHWEKARTRRLGMSLEQKIIGARYYLEAARIAYSDAANDFVVARDRYARAEEECSRLELLVITETNKVS